jgi:hypothetical protein
MLKPKLNDEMKAFKKSYETMEPMQVYNDWYIICFYESYYELLSHIIADDSGYGDCQSLIDWLDTFEKPLYFLWKEWMGYDGSLCLLWDDMIAWLYDLKDDIEYWNNPIAQ